MAMPPPLHRVQHMVSLSKPWAGGHHLIGLVAHGLRAHHPGAAHGVGVRVGPDAAGQPRRALVGQRDGGIIRLAHRTTGARVRGGHVLEGGLAIQLATLDLGAPGVVGPWGVHPLGGHGGNEGSSNEGAHGWLW
eukprot:CAMPEP_0204390010 /NCGR_PEP_ID=MMETSP0469-20131031/60437_1 /ASSEMBLY_ACC=CAM_ASM_000384 /TAXON_ID=2969 /ORGANISM="Oxyrrhis marina" /LENGTH=133 /DNA_ID=CAMNT_0051383777 /DNA_START=88 /DNA_END=488 /DNA_ORIENTATION=+